MNNHQIAAELHEALKYYTDEKQRIFIIEAAIEKARQEGYEAGYRDGGFAASRAADLSCEAVAKQDAGEKTDAEFREALDHVAGNYR